ncbi:MAG: TetR/AcrR family transcriptional regulator [Gemmatimonadaceae bacterium]
MTTGTEDDLIAATRQLMLRQGYAGTGINEICRVAGVSKGAFYHFFESKEALAIAALERFYRERIDELMAIDVSAAAPGDALPLFLERVAARAPRLWEHGCLIGGLATETALASDRLQREVARLFDQFAERLAQLAKPFVASRATGKLNATAIAEDILAIVEGTIVLSRAHRDPRRIRSAITRYAQSLRRLPRR